MSALNNKQKKKKPNCGGESPIDKWYEIVKKELLLSEPQNILARARCCSDVVNLAMPDIHSNLNLKELPPSLQYKHSVVTADHLDFLYLWPGLRKDNTPKRPANKKEYEKKAKNWLNGRRAPNYGKTLFPFFIQTVETYCNKISISLFGENTNKQNLYYDIVIYKILSDLCNTSVSLHEQAKKAPFFCKNSVERKGKLKEILQKYATGHPYVSGFPSCFDEAVGFFNNKSNEFQAKWKKLYSQNKNNNKNAKYKDIIDIDTDNDDNNNNNIDDLNLNRDDIELVNEDGGQHNINLDDIKSERKRKRKKTSKTARITSTNMVYWMNKVMNLEIMLKEERRLRATVESERDTLRRLIEQPDTSNDLLAAYSVGDDGSAEYQSSNGSLNQSLPSLHSSYSGNSHPTMQMHDNTVNNLSHHMPPPLYVPNNTSMQINHAPHHQYLNNTQQQQQMVHVSPASVYGGALMNGNNNNNMWNSNYVGNYGGSYYSSQAIPGSATNRNGHPIPIIPLESNNSESTFSKPEMNVNVNQNSAGSYQSFGSFGFDHQGVLNNNTNNNSH